MKPNPDAPLDRPHAGYRILQLVFRAIFGALGNWRVEGVENVPPTGPLLVINNHLSMLDPPLLFIGIPRTMTGFVADKYRQNLFLRWLTETVRGIWIRQSEADLDALREALRHLKGGGALGLAIEGTRSRTGGLIQGKPGAAYLADRSGVPILPVVVMGTETGFKDLLRLRRPHLRLRIGRPVRLTSTGRAKAEKLDEFTAMLMCHLAALLPQPYRGVYADHPYLPQAIAYQTGDEQHIAADVSRMDVNPTRIDAC